jgi:type I restriction enzyme R subunit
MAHEFLNPWSEVEMHGSDLPHWQQGEALQFVTFRLKDSLPQEKLREWKQRRQTWMRLHPAPWDAATQATYHKEFTHQLEQWLDLGHGSCLLKAAKNRKIIEEVLQHDHGTRAELISWVIMPNHVHLLFQPMYPMEDLLRNWKSISAKQIGEGPIWQRNYRDTILRNERHFEAVVRYIRNNPAKLPAGTFTLWESERAKSV